MKSKYKILCETLGIAWVGAIICTLIHVPLPWLLGSLSSIAAWRLITGRPLYQPPMFSNIALILLGFLLGSSFTKETSLQILHQLPLMLLSTLLIVLISLCLGMITARRLKLDLASVLFGSVPGGLSQMVVFCQEIKGIDPTIVMFIQIIRVVSVVFIVPFITMHGMGADSIAQVPFSPTESSLEWNWTWSECLLYGFISVMGYFIGKRIGLPSTLITGPLIATALYISLSGDQAPHVPLSIVLLSQFAIGISIGLQVKPEMLKSMKSFGAYSLGGSMVLILSSLLFAFSLTAITPMTLTTAFLSTAPGGIAEMGLTATVVHADLSMVSGYQLFRVLFILFLIPPTLQWWLNRQKEKSTENVKYNKDCAP